MTGSQLGTGMARRMPKGTPVGSRLKSLCDGDRARHRARLALRAAGLVLR